MTIGSELYSDLYIAKFIEKMKKQNTLCDTLILILAAVLLLIAGFSNLIAIEFFNKFHFKDWHSVIMVILGGIYIIESCILMINFFCCRNTMIVLICAVLSIINFIVGIYRTIDLNEWSDYYVVFPLMADLIIIPILIYTYCKSKKSMDQHQFVLLEDNNNNKVIIPKYGDNGKIHSKNSLLTDFTEKRINTEGLDIGEDDIDSNLLSGSNVNGQNEDDEKAEVLIMDTPGGNIGEIRISDDD